MAVIRHAVLTLNGTAQNPATALADKDILTFISFQADGANSGLIYIGGKDGATVSSSVYGFRIEIPVSTVPSAPSVFEFSAGMFSLADFRVIGNNNDKLHIFTIAK